MTAVGGQSDLVLRDGKTAEFLDGLARGELLMRECGNCGVVSEPSALTCSACGNGGLQWSRAGRQGQVVSWAVAHERTCDGGTERVVLVIAQLAAGPWLWSRLVGADASEVAIGAQLILEFAAHASGETIPVFRLASSAAQPAIG
jgi:uncharacterized OB-fold protein